MHSNRSNSKVKSVRDSIESELSVAWLGSKDSGRSKKSPTAADILLTSTNAF
jgi:hypothetical protein